MSNPPLWIYRSKLSAKQGNITMAGIAAGVVTQADVNKQPRFPSKFQRNLSSPATWSYIWVTAAFIYLLVTYLGIFRISRIGD